MTGELLDGVVTVVVPVRDEAATIEAALESLVAQTIGAQRLDVLVYDGCSGDATAELCRAYAERAPWHRFEVRTNALCTVPHALNAGLADAAGAWYTRIDGRTALSANYLEACVAAADRHGAASAVGGALVADADGGVAESIAAVVTHRLGVGSGFRVPIAAETEVPHHPFAVWRTTDVRDHGGFRGELTRNQDDEFSMRARSRGARIFALPEATVRYRPRERLRGLAVQYFQYGLWKAAVGRTEGLFPLRSLAPAGVTVAAAVALGVAARGRSRVPLALGTLVYGGAGVVIARARPRARLGWTAAALATTHLAYGAGLLTGVTRPGLVRSRRAAVQGRVR